MKDTCRYWAAVTRLVLGVLLVALCLGSSAAQELQIMVNGPWAYAFDPTQPDRVFLVAPNTTHHNLYIFSGTSASDTSQLNSGTKVSFGLYTLAFDFRGPYTKSADDAPLVCSAANVDQINVIDPIIQGKSGLNPYVISVPKPDGYSTYIDKSGQIDGYSESKVYSASSRNDPAAVAPQLYTTWMVLHYGVTSIPSLVTMSGPKGIVSYKTAGTPSGISIVTAMDPSDYSNSFECDTASIESFLGQNQLWGLTNTRYARFPLELDGQGHQVHYQYDYACSDDKTTVNQAKKTRLDVKQHTWVRSNILSGGSADCHACQMSINGVGPQPPIQ